VLYAFILFIFLYEFLVFIEMLDVIWVFSYFSRCLGFRLLRDHVFRLRQYLGFIDVAERVYIIYGLLSHFVWFVVLFCLVCDHIFLLLSSLGFVVSMLQKCFIFLYGLRLLVVPFCCYYLVSGLLFRVAEKFGFYFYTICCG
jgi:hypothetical protein